MKNVAQAFGYENLPSFATLECFAPSSYPLEKFVCQKEQQFHLIIGFNTKIVSLKDIYERQRRDKSLVSYIGMNLDVDYSPYLPRYWVSQSKSDPRHSASSYSHNMQQSPDFHVYNYSNYF